ncbi:MAG: hypothetical protein ABR591_14430 [Candidatus Velthaea sp.]
MKTAALIGAAAGAVGTLALDAATYTDMAVRGRPASSMTQTLVAKLAQKAGIAPLAAEQPDDATKNRQTGVGALLGYVNGVGVGLVYAAARPLLRDRVPLAVTGILAGALAMALTDVTAAALGAADPKEWDAASWVADIVPHAVYGFATVLAYEGLRAQDIA